MSWVTTGIWGNVISSVSGSQLLHDSVEVLFIQNDTASNDILLQRVRFAPAFFGDVSSVIAAHVTHSKNLLVPNKRRIYLSDCFLGSTLIVRTMRGRVVSCKAIESTTVSLLDLPLGIYLLSVENGTKELLITERHLLR